MAAVVSAEPVRTLVWDELQACRSPGGSRLLSAAIGGPQATSCARTGARAGGPRARSAETPASPRVKPEPNFASGWGHTVGSHAGTDRTPQVGDAHSLAWRCELRRLARATPDSRLSGRSSDLGRLERAGRASRADTPQHRRVPNSRRRRGPISADIDAWSGANCRHVPGAVGAPLQAFWLCRCQEVSWFTREKSQVRNPPRPPVRTTRIHGVFRISGASVGPAMTLVIRLTSGRVGEFPWSPRTAPTGGEDGRNTRERVRRVAVREPRRCACIWPSFAGVPRSLGGLSRRRSRVRVPSLPSREEALRAGVSACSATRHRRPRVHI